ncbi:hypothetical protein [Anaerotignum sp.]
MTFANQEIRTSAKKSGVPFWRIALEIGVSEPTFTRKMRLELSDEEKQKIFAIIDRLSAEKK